MKSKKINGKANIIGKNIQKYRLQQDLSLRQLSDKLSLYSIYILLGMYWQHKQKKYIYNYSSFLHLEQIVLLWYIVRSFILLQKTHLL